MPLPDFLSTNPRAAFASNIPLTSPMSRFFLDRYNEYYNRYLGRLGEQARMGQQLPSLRFSNFLQDINWGQEYGGFSPRSRGIYQSTFAPPARWLNY